MIYIVLGMHKSGTTLIAEMLHKSGINMIDDQEKREHDMNLYEVMESDTQKGDYKPRALRHTAMLYERISTFLLNQEILVLNNKTPVKVNTLHSLDEVDYPPLRVMPDHMEKMKGIISGCNRRYMDWGFKDPRTCITYELWNSEIPEHKLIIVFRSYGEVIRHYGAAGWRQLNLILTWKALRAWNYYNRKIIEITKNTNQPMIVMDYGELMSNSAELHRLEEFIGMPVYDARKGNLRHQRSINSFDMPAVGQIATRLLDEQPSLILDELISLSKV